MMLDTIKTIKNNYACHCEGQRDEAIYKADTMDCRARFLSLRRVSPLRERSLTMTKTGQRGNAMVYVLIALALFGFLTATLSRSNNQADEQDIDNEQAELYALELMEYAASAQAVVDQMLFSGSEIDDLDFVMPSDAAFNTPPHHHKVYHPQGGGLSYKGELPDAIQASATSSYWRAINITNVEWTPSIENDVMISAMRMNPEICEIINLKITGSKVVPALTVPAVSRFFQILPSVSNSDFNISDCPDCEGHTNLCVTASGGSGHTYYSIIAAQ